MKIINSSYEILQCPTGDEALKAIELAARTCYKSEDKITNDSAKKLVLNLLKRGHHAMIEFMPDIIIKFISNRGFTHELVRHRLCSFAQESTRYVAYDKGKHGSEIKVLDKCIPMNETQQSLYYKALELAEINYMQLRRLGLPAEIAREVLPIGLKAEIVIKANVREWRQIFYLRCAPSAHPRMRELMIPLLSELQNRIPVLFDDLAEKYLSNEKEKS